MAEVDGQTPAGRPTWPGVWKKTLIIPEDGDALETAWIRVGDAPPDDWQEDG